MRHSRLLLRSSVSELRPQRQLPPVRGLPRRPRSGMHPRPILSTRSPPITAGLTTAVNSATAAAAPPPPLLPLRPTAAALATPARRGPPRSARAPPGPPPAITTPLKLDASVYRLLPFLAGQPGHYITIHVHNRAYLVTPGDRLRLPYLVHGVLPGDRLRFNRASLIGSRDFSLKGAPYIDERLYECRGTVLGVETEPLRIKIKKKQRCRRTKYVKSKHRFTVLRISELKIIQPSDVPVAAA